MNKLVLIRHGESLWNRDQRFTGWVDIDITERGARQARHAATLLKEAGYSFDLAFTSVLKRAIRSQWIIADELDLMWIPQISHWRLNEKHYGALTGLSKKAAAIQYGQEQVLLWRRSYDTRAPALEEEDPRSSRNDPRYAQLAPAQIPLTESLEDTVLRILPLWNESIAPAIMAGKRVIITAHGNSIRALIKHLDHISNQAIVDLDIPNGVPIIYTLDNDLQVISREIMTCTHAEA